MTKSGDIVLGGVLILMIVSVGLIGPGRITRTVLDTLHWTPVKTTEAIQVQTGPRTPRGYVEQIREPDVRATLKQFASLPSRVVGYPGIERAYETVRSTFEDIGLEDITTETFEVTVPIDKGAYLTLKDTGEQIPLYCLWPNQVKTPSLPSEGITGPLIYGGKGHFHELNGQVVEGSIVLMDFDCGQRYINPRMLGAQAVIFFDNGGINRDQASDKFLSVPADVPRYWVDQAHAHKLLDPAASGDRRVTLHARMDWETVEAKNIYGVLPGSDERMPAGERGDRGRWKDHLIVVEAYYDAMSVVPGVAPGAENACGITGLLHVARLLKEHGTQYSMLFLATSAHFEGLSGVNDFLYRHARKSSYFRERMALEDRIDFRLFIGLDLSSHNDQVGTFTMGTFYTAWSTNNYQKNMMAPYSKKFSGYVERLFSDADRHVDAIAPSKRTWKNFMPVPIGLDSEAPIFVGLRGISWVTTHDVRERVDTPCDRLEGVDVGMLTRQIRTIGGILLEATHDEDLFEDSELKLRDQGHSLKGTIYWFNREVHFAVPQDPVPGAVVTYQHVGPNSVAGVRTLMVTKTDAHGRFRFDIMRNAWSNKILAYVLDEDGSITSAPDLGQDGNGSYPITQRRVWWEDEMVEVLFHCRALSLFEIVDSRHLVALDSLTPLGMDDSPLQWYGSDYVANQSRKEGKVTQAAVVYAKPGTPVKLFMSTGLFGIKYLLTHAPRRFLDRPIGVDEITPELLDEAKGNGYVVDQGVIFRPLVQSARDMWILDDARMKMLAKYGVRNEKLFRLHREAKEALEEAREHLANLEYDAFMAAARRAAGLENRGYPDVKATANDTVKGIIFYFVLLLPFSVFCERLLFGFADIRKRIAGFAGIFVLMFLVLRFVHPAFKLSTSPYVIFLAFVIFAMGTVVIAMISSKFKQEMGKMKQAASGVHEADVGRLSATFAAVVLGISNLRKRKVRTALTAVTLILVSFTVLSFTSFRTSLKFYKLPRGNKPPYQGALVRDRSWQGLQEVVLDYVRSAFGQSARVVPRSWVLSRSKGERAYIRFDVVKTPARISDSARNPQSAIRNPKSSFANALLGMTPDEPRIMGLDRLLIGSSRWFEPGERKVCILPDDMAQLVGITEQSIGRAVIRMLGAQYRVIGIIDSEAFNRIKGMDGEKLTPVDTVSEAAKMSKEARQDPRLLATAPFQSFTHLESSNTMMLPYEEVMALGGTLESIAIVEFRDERGRPKADFREDVEAFVARVSLPIFVGIGDRVTVYSSIGATSLSGVGNLIVPILIGALIVLNTMMGAVYERFREIGIYSSVGLAPVHIAALFLAEAAVFATIGAVMGYLIGQVTALVLVQRGMLGGMSLNYSSLSAIWSTLIVMATVFLSTLYPAKRAAAMAVPDVTRKWTFPDPVGDDWMFDFPFTVGGTEVLGMYGYLTRMFESYGESSIGDFLTERVLLSAEDRGGQPSYRISMMTWLAPYDLGISQEVQLEAIPTGEHNIYRIVMHIRRLSGDAASWQRINRGFLNVLRKRFLVWRTIPAGVKEEYAAWGREAVGT